MLEKLELRIKELEHALNQSVASHNMILGQLTEARYILESVKSTDDVVEGVIDAVSPVELPTEQAAAE